MGGVKKRGGLKEEVRSTEKKENAHTRQWGDLSIEII